jgi:hydrogenase nickel incorporation protein HypA/HybF
MHEFSICETLVTAVLDELDRLNADGPHRLLKTRVVAGRLRQIVPENLKFAYEVLTADTPAAGSALEVRITAAVARCGACGWEGEMEDFLVRCGRCGGTDIEWRSGMELYLDTLEVDTDAPA